MDDLPARRFRLDLGGVSATFAEALNLPSRSGPARTASPDDTAQLERVVLRDGVADLPSWNTLLQLADGKLPPAEARVSRRDDAGDTSWRLARAWPIALSGKLAGHKGAKTNEVAIESLELSHEGLVVEPR